MKYRSSIENNLPRGIVIEELDISTSLDRFRDLDLDFIAILVIFFNNIILKIVNKLILRYRF